MDRKVMLYIAASLDGYIAKPNDDLNFLALVHEEGEDYGYADFMKTVDAVILGRRTYDWVMTQVSEFPHADLDTYVITRSPRPGQGKTHFYSGPIHDLIDHLKTKNGKNIFIDGGAEIVNALLMEKQIDEIIISVIPVLVGGGIRLFQDGRPEQLSELVSVKHYKTGLVQLHYRMKRAPRAMADRTI